MCNLKTQPRVGIILLNWNGRDDTLACLHSLLQLDYPNYRIILVDNASTDGLVDVVRTDFPAVTVLQNAENLGFAEGNNVGMRYALTLACDYILLLNNDTVVAPDFLSKLIAVSEANPELGMLSPYIYHYDAPEKLWFYRASINWMNGYGNHDESPDKDRMMIYMQNEYFDDSDYLSGCALLVKSIVIQKIGMLDSRFFAYYEDVDWSLRCKRAGWQLAVVPSASIWHKSTSDGNSDYGKFLSYRNTILFLWKHSNLWQFLGRVRRHIYRALAEYSWDRDKHYRSDGLHPLDGVWAGIFGKYGNDRQKMPRWAQTCCYRYYRYFLWLFRSPR